MAPAQQRAISAHVHTVGRRCVSTEKSMVAIANPLAACDDSLAIRGTFTSLRLAPQVRGTLRINRCSAALSVLAAGALLLVSACGNDNNASSGTTAPGTSAVKVTCGGKPTLKSSGSTAQANAMTRFVKAFEQACPGQTVNYTPNGSGAGIGEFTGNQTDFGWLGLDIGAQRVRRGAKTLRLAGVGTAGGVRPDRDHVQRQGRDFADSRRSDRSQDLQRHHRQVERSRNPVR